MPIYPAWAVAAKAIAAPSAIAAAAIRCNLFLFISISRDLRNTPPSYHHACAVCEGFQKRNTRAYISAALAISIKLCRNVGFPPLGGQQLHGIRIERYEGLAAEPAPFIGDDAVRKIPAIVQHLQTCRYRSAIDDNVGAFKQMPNRSCDLSGGGLVSSGKHPDQLAE